MEAIPALLKTVFGWPARYYMAIALACVGLIGLSASSWAETLGILGLSAPVRSGLTITALTAAALWAAKTSYLVQGWIMLPLRRRRIRQHMRHLTPDEQLILLWHFVRNNRTIHVDYTNQVAQALRAKGILSYAGGSGHILAAPHFISEAAWSALEQRETLSPLAANDRVSLMGLSERALYQSASPMRRQLGFNR